MTRRELVFFLTACVASELMVGCRAENADKERARIEIEDKATREAESGNRAITDLNRRLFGRAPDGSKVNQPPKGGDSSLGTQSPPQP